MNQIITLWFIYPIYAGVMGAKSDDDIYVYFSVIAFLGLILGILYIIRFLHKLKNNNAKT